MSKYFRESLGIRDSFILLPYLSKLIGWAQILTTLITVLPIDAYDRLLGLRLLDIFLAPK